MTDTSDIPRSRYAIRGNNNLVVDLAKARRRAATKAVHQPNRKLGFARVFEDAFLPLATLVGDHALGLVLMLMMRSGLTSTQRNEGWIALPQTTLNQIDLSNRWRRNKAVSRLVARGVLETRRASLGAALEYRLRPMDQWQTKS